MEAKQLCPQNLYDIGCIGDAQNASLNHISVPDYDLPKWNRFG